MKGFLGETIFAADADVRLFFRLWFIGTPLLLSVFVAIAFFVTAPPY